MTYRHDLQGRPNALLKQFNLTVATQWFREMASRDQVLSSTLLDGESCTSILSHLKAEHPVDHIGRNQIWNPQPQSLTNIASANTTLSAAAGSA